MSCPAAAPKAVTSLRSATNAQSVTLSNPSPDGQAALSFPKARRLLRNSEFRKVYDEGFRIACPYFAAFCLRWAGPDGPRVGFTVPRSLGKSVVRNRMKRRMREAARLHLSSLGSDWAVVFNPRRALLDAPFEVLEREVERVFSKCGSAE
jgi:ribonuclease P protein component